MSRPAAAALLVILEAAGGAAAKTMIEPCAVADACPALLGYALYADMKVSEVAALFGADSAALLAVNSLDFASPGAANRIHPAGLALRMPTRSACADAVRKSVSVRYAARPADTLASVADVVFAGLAAEDPRRAARPRPDARSPPPLRLLQLHRQQPPHRVVRVGDTLQSVAASHATTAPPLRISAT